MQLIEFSQSGVPSKVSNAKIILDRKKEIE